MKIVFSREWNKSTIRNIVENNSYLEFGKHEDLKAVCMQPYAEDDTFYNSDYYELTFIVPAKWLKNITKKMFEVDDLDNWLQNEYTTNESELIFERALNERQVVTVDFC